MDSANQTNCCVIDAICGIDTSSPHISQFTDSFNQIKFLLKKNMENYTFMIITDSDGYVQLITTDSENLIKEKDENSNTVLLWNIGKEITASSGALLYQIAAYLTEDGETKSVWYSKEGRLFVSESIDSTNYSTKLIGSQPNLITRLILKCEELLSSVKKNTEKLSGIEDGAKANVLSDWNETDEDSDAFIKNKPVVDTVLNPGSNNAISNSAVSSEFTAIGNVLNAAQKQIGSNAEEIEKGTAVNEGTSKDLTAHRMDGFEDEKHLTNEEKANVAKLPKLEEEVTILREEMDGIHGEDFNAIWKAVNTNADKIDMMEAKPVYKIPSTLKPNTAYNFDIQTNITLSFPSVANDGDVIYVSFQSLGTLNLVVDTTNTYDFELIPEMNTGYEIYAKYIQIQGVGKWIVKYSGYTGV